MTIRFRLPINFNSYPALLLTAVIPFTPVLSRPLIRFSGIPHKPNPKTKGHGEKYMITPGSTSFKEKSLQRRKCKSQAGNTLSWGGRLIHPDSVDICVALFIYQMFV